MVILGLEDTKRLGGRYSGTGAIAVEIARLFCHGNLAPVFHRSEALRWLMNSWMWFSDHRSNQNYINKPRIGYLP